MCRAFIANMFVMQHIVAPMNKIIVHGIIALAASMLASQIAQAQGTVTYLSNLGQPSMGGLAVDSGSWLAEGILTGNNTGGYVLNNVQLAMMGISGSPSGFTVMLYNQSGDLGGIDPGSSLGMMSGSSPTSDGTYTYTAPAHLLLSPDTYYFIVATSRPTVGYGAYSWSFTTASSYKPGDSWIESISLGSSDGLSSTWKQNPDGPQFEFLQFAINATAVPEPDTMGLLGMGGLFFGLSRWKMSR